MNERVLDPKTAAAYAVVTKKINRIGSQVTKVHGGALGNVLTVENITEKIGSLDPNDWFKNEEFEGAPLTFNDLKEEDRAKVQAALEDLITTPKSQKDLEDKFQACGRLAYEFSKKILERKKETVAE